MFMLLTGCSRINSGVNKVDQSSGNKSSVTSGQVDWSNQVSISPESYTTENVSDTYPSVFGLKNKIVQGRINLLLKKESMIGGQRDRRYLSFYQIAYKHGDVIDFVFTTLLTPKSATGDIPSPIRKSLIVNLKTGDTYSWNDLFRTNSDYFRKLDQVVTAENTNQTQGKSLEINQTNQFYLTPKGIIVSFPSETFINRVSSFLISFQSVDYLINKNGPLWMAINDNNGFTQNSNYEILDFKAASSLGYSAPFLTDWCFNYSEANTNNGQTLSAIVGFNKQNQREVLFFVNGKFVGTDAKHSKTAVILDMISQGGGSISIEYLDPSQSPYSIFYYWNGSELIQGQKTPVGYG